MRRGFKDGRSPTRDEPVMGRRAFALLRQLEDVLGVAVLLAIGTIVLIQVVFRYVLGTPVKWSDELGRVLLAWLTFVGASAVAKVGGHPRVNVLRDWARRPVRRLFDGFADACSVVLLLLGAYYGFLLTTELTNVRLVTLDASWAWWYAAFPVGATLMLLRTVERGWRRARRGSGEAPVILGGAQGPEGEDPPA